MNEKILNAIRDERRAQDAQWGGPEHDDTHIPLDWVSFIEHQIHQIYVNGQTQERLVKIAALAIAALESFERDQVQ